MLESDRSDYAANELQYKKLSYHHMDVELHTLENQGKAREVVSKTDIYVLAN